MASNRLFIYDPDNNVAICIAKGYSSGWYSCGLDKDVDNLNSFFDENEEYTTNIDATRYVLKTEMELPEDVYIVGYEMVKINDKNESDTGV